MTNDTHSQQTLDLPIGSQTPIGPVIFQDFGESAYPLNLAIHDDGCKTILEITGTLPAYQEYCLHDSLWVSLLPDDDSGYTAKAIALPVVGYGKTASEALFDLLESVGSSWSRLNGRPDHELTKDAIELRDALEQRLFSSRTKTLM